MPQFYTKWKRKSEDPLENHGPSHVETAGYVPAKVKIEQMILAGQRLVDWRKEQFDFSPEVDDDDNFVDPTRTPGYDMADAHQDMMETEERLKTRYEGLQDSGIMPPKILEEATQKRELEAAEAQEKAPEAEKKDV